jgi:cell wall assembly regulator SMI1
MSAAELSRAWTTWLDTLESHGFAAREVTRPGASDEDLARITELTGIGLPTDVVTLYRHSDGQQDVWPRRWVGDKITTDLFPMYRFLPIAEACRSWRGWKDIFDSYGPSGMADFAEHVTVPEPDKVAKEYWIPGWWPLAEDGGGNLLAVDTAPLDGGTAGQIIVLGSDEDEREIFADGITAYLTLLSTTEPEISSPEEDVLIWDMPTLR